MSSSKEEKSNLVGYFDTALLYVLVEFDDTMPQRDCPLPDFEQSIDRFDEFLFPGVSVDERVDSTWERERTL